MSGWKGLWKKVSAYADQEAKKKEIKVEGIEKEEDDMVTAGSKIASILMQAADDGTTVEISFGSRILTYKTKILFDVDKDPGGAGGSELSSEYLRSGQYMLIDTIDPPEGNDKLRATSMASMLFPQSNKFNEFHARLLEDLGGGEVDENGVVKPSKFMLEFPHTIFRKVQRRASARFEVPGKAMIVLTVERPALVTFRAQLLNLGTGGLSFQQPDDVAPLTENCHLKLTFNWPPENQLVIPGTLVKNKSALGKTRVHVRFSIETFEMSRAIGELVTHIERMELKERSDKNADVVADGIASDYHETAAELRRKKSK